MKNIEMLYKFSMPQMTSDTTAYSPPAAMVSGPHQQELIAQVTSLREECVRGYSFNNRWDVLLSTLGILLSVAIVGAGFIRRPEVSAILGAAIGALVTAQKAFPFGQRANFYRLLIGQTDNLSTRIANSLLTLQAAVDALSTLRMDYAQQLPRGTSGAQAPVFSTRTEPQSAGNSSRVDDDVPSINLQGESEFSEQAFIQPALVSMTSQPEQPAPSPLGSPTNGSRSAAPLPRHSIPILSVTTPRS